MQLQQARTHSIIIHHSSFIIYLFTSTKAHQKQTLDDSGLPIAVHRAVPGTMITTCSILLEC
jgi:hypothetical protein